MAPRRARAAAAAGRRRRRGERRRHRDAGDGAVGGGGSHGALNRDFHGLGSALRTRTRRHRADATQDCPDGEDATEVVGGRVRVSAISVAVVAGGVSPGGPGARPPRTSRIARSWRRFSACPCTSTSRCEPAGVCEQHASIPTATGGASARPLATRWRRRPRTRIGAWRRARALSPMSVNRLRSDPAHFRRRRRCWDPRTTTPRRRRRR